MKAMWGNISRKQYILSCCFLLSAMEKEYSLHTLYSLGRKNSSLKGMKFLHCDQDWKSATVTFPFGVNRPAKKHSLSQIDRRSFTPKILLLRERNKTEATRVLFLLRGRSKGGVLGESDRRAFRSCFPGARTKAFLLGVVTFWASGQAQNNQIGWPLRRKNAALKE